MDDSGEFAELQPGLTNGELVRGLWEQGKQTTTGICLCAGIMGIMLGGGHGYMQGRYGLVTDQILEARVVLADGSWVTASPRENTDLFWALRGAGHNFGIITGVKFKVYDRLEEWSEVQMIFSEDKLEAVFQLSNDYIEEANHPPELTVWHLLARMDDLSDDAVVVMSLIYRGRFNDLEPYVAPFRDIGPLAEQQHDGVPFVDLFDINVLTEASTTCDRGLYRHLAPTYLRQYNSTSLRKVYDIFNGITAKYPEMGTHSTFMIEGYPIQGVTSIHPEDTAAPFRDYPLLLSPQLGYTNPAHSNDILAANKDMRRAIVEGSGSEQLNAYVNYASGDESLPELYGHEPWRMRKLRELKRKYDPTGKFNFYMPIS
ncbi:related to oxidoreductase [Cephalotrichum gorgonifer]|uniref:Related to oxidoreductase n=1 Tax=Cephalotrichum gorgonifer TaxID=2041049 RepID=A0AAE8N894_9PEZI|nr:related to oxidoreductase [Cephalotrichum gorgonifer]